MKGILVAGMVSLVLALLGTPIAIRVFRRQQVPQRRHRAAGIGHAEQFAVPGPLRPGA